MPGRVIDLDRTPITPELIEELRAAPRVILSGPDRLYRSLFERTGISWEPLGATEPGDGDVLVRASDEPSIMLIGLVNRLLGVEGCPWDREQTHASLRRHLIEEAYEVIEAIEGEDRAALKEELGDLLLQPLLHGQIASYRGDFDSDAISEQLIEKLIRRHPHVFGDVTAEDSETVLANWNRIKRAEPGYERRTSALDGVPKGLPALMSALEISKRAAKVGFEWPNLDGVFEKLHEELEEVRSALQVGTPEEVEAEIGDVLFTVVNIARWSKVDPEQALRTMVERFSGRFREMESRADKPLVELTAAEWDALWNAAKRSTSDPT